MPMNRAQFVPLKSPYCGILMRAKLLVTTYYGCLTHESAYANCVPISRLDLHPEVSRTHTCIPEKLRWNGRVVKAYDLGQALC